VANSSALPAGNIIESASALFGSGATKVTRLHPEATGEKHQLAMTRRLEQLQAALGETATAPEPAVDRKNPPPVARRGFGTSALFITSLLSTLFGASLMWLATQHEPAPGKPAVEVQSIATQMPAAAAIPAAVAPKLEITDEKQLGDLLEAWRSAWTQRDTAAYLSTYSQDFAPADGNGREAWVEARKKKLSTGAPIDVRIHNLGLERIDEHHFKATFRQDYASGSYREIARPKTLLIAREGSDWRITREWQE
jgi:ketosteroid isomerase-like protein